MKLHWDANLREAIENTLEFKAAVGSPIAVGSPVTIGPPIVAFGSPVAAVGSPIAVSSPVTFVSPVIETGVYNLLLFYIVPDFWRNFYVKLVLYHMYGT